MTANFVSLFFCAIYLTDCSVFCSTVVPFFSILGLAGKKCSSANNTFTKKTNSAIACTAQCKITDGCRSVFYSNETGICYGCSVDFDMHTNNMNLENASGTTYFHSGVCPSGWSKRGDSCYIVKDEELDWDDALAHCQSLNASLLEPDDADEDNFGQNLVSGIAWIGLNDRADEGIFRLVESNAVPTYTNWSLGQPDGGIIQNCVCYYQNAWHDNHCWYNTTFVCEKATRTYY